MSLSDSMFVFEIKIQDLLSYIECKEFYVRCQFADIFNVHLKDPNEIDTLLPKKKKKTKQKGREVSKITKPLEIHKTSQSIIVESSINSLKDNMKSFPIELSLWGKDDPDNKVGSASIPWSPVYYEYLNKLNGRDDLHPAFVSGGYNVFDETTSKRMAIIRLNVKLTFIKDIISSPYQALFEHKQKSLHYAGFNSKDTTTLQRPRLQDIKTGVIKTFYSGGKRKNPQRRKSKKKIECQVKEELLNNSEDLKKESDNEQGCNDDKEILCKTGSSFLSLKVKKSRSDADLDKSKLFELRRSISQCLRNHDRFNMLNYIYGSNGPFESNVYCVGYFTVENDKTPTPSVKSEIAQTSPKEPTPSLKSEKGQTSPTVSDPSVKSGKTQSSPGVPGTPGVPSSAQSSEKINEEPKRNYKIKICDNQTPCSQSQYSVDLPEAAADFITVKKCTQIDCHQRKFNEPPTPPDDRVLLDLTHMYNMECGSKKVEGPCFCTCECTFGFVKRTTYCTVCGGFEKVGEDFSTKTPNMPFPCPIFHKIQKTAKPPVKPEKTDSDRDSKKKKKKKDDRFKFNYGYTAPQIGHSQCAMPCTGALGPVPKNMGWLWTAEDIPGMKFRPLWRPGATNKHVVRLLKIAKNPGEVIKKRRRDTGKKKRPLKRPLLIVHKKEGEYTVTMETMKTFTRPRAINQHPYEDKPVLTYTIGRTEEENKIRRMKKERMQRRLEREQREYIQSAFTDMCKEICLKTYRQALGILKDAEDPDCICYPADPGPDKINLEHSCSCSEDKSYISTDTDSDEWIVEFTPPNATFDPTVKPKRIFKVDNSCQYTYLDYRVKLLDRYGNAVPRFFKGPDGKTQCSDLGGFWSPDHKWLEINIDGYVAPDGRWAPMNFIGPSGEDVDCEAGNFQASNGKWLVVGIDGFVDAHGKWKFYPKPRGAPPEPKSRDPRKKKNENIDKKDNKKGKPSIKPSEATWSCFGDASPKTLSKLGIMGHGHDKKMLLATLQDMLNHGEDVTLPVLRKVPRPSSKKSKGKQRVINPDAYDSRSYFLEKEKCYHPVPSDKGIVAVDDHGNKTYFRLKDYKNKRPKERLVDLTKHGISLSSFHVPCLNSFINAEMMKRQLYERRLRMAGIEDQEVAQGWKPGAINKQLLRKLNQAKILQSTDKHAKRTKRNKKQVEDKPTLIICKRNGEYIIEMQATSENDNCKPVIYKIAKESNSEKIRARTRKEKRLIKEAIEDVWSDPYHPEACDAVCYKAYQQTLGIFPGDPYFEERRPESVYSPSSPSESYSCDGVSISTDSSLDVDWEIHFTPPIYCTNNSKLETSLGSNP